MLRCFPPPSTSLVVLVLAIVEVGRLFRGPSAPDPKPPSNVTAYGDYYYYYEYVAVTVAEEEQASLVHWWWFIVAALVFVIVWCSYPRPRRQVRRIYVQ